jgi:hypothetical protein
MRWCIMSQTLNLKQDRMTLESEKYLQNIFTFIFFKDNSGNIAVWDRVKRLGQKISPN